MIVIVNAGHHLFDSGNVTHGQREADLTMQIRDEIRKLLPNATFVPDSLDLRASISWTNSQIGLENAIAIDIHLNANNNEHVRGVEAYYADNSELADVFAREVALAQGIPNRGARHDSETYVGSLGWLRQLDCPSVVLEGCYMTNEADMAQFDAKKIAVGVVNAVRTQEKISWLKKKILALVKQVEALIAQRYNV